MQITIYYANCCGNPKNTAYPYSSTVSTEEDFAALVSKDHMFSAMRGGRRNNSNFVEASAIGSDFDNEHSDNPDDWIWPEDIPKHLPDVACAVYTSRNHMKPKGPKTARPRFHMVAPVPTLTSCEDYSALMDRLQAYLPFADSNARDPARFFFGNPDSEVIFFEGSRTLDTFLDEQGQREEQEFAAFVAQHSAEPWAEPIPEGSRNKTLHVTAIKMLKRYGESEASHMAYQEAADRCIPPLPEEELSVIWNSALKFYREKILRQPGYIPPAQYGASPAPQWEQPLPLDPPAAPEFPVDCLPSPLAAYVRAVAECIQAPLGMVASCVLALLAVCLQGKYKITAKEGWVELLNLYLLIILGPSERKSAVLNLLVKPLVQFERKYNMDHAQEFETSEREQSILEKRKSMIEDKIVKGKAKMEELSQAVQESQGHRVSKPLKLFSDNITTEKLCSVMEENGDRAAILTTESGLFDLLAGTYSDHVNIDIFLKAYSGDRVIVERIGRADDRLENPILTMLLMGQNSSLTSLMSNKKFTRRGLTSRFFYSLPESIVGSRPYRTEEIPPESQRAYEDLLRNLLTDSYPVHAENTPLITLSPEASLLHQAFYEELEILQGTEYKNYPDMKEWVGKLAGNVLRVAGLLARAQEAFPYPSIIDSFDDRAFKDDDLDVFRRYSANLVVDRMTMAHAVEIGRYYLCHAGKAFSLMNADLLTADCRYVRDVILEKELFEFSSRTILRECRRFKTKAEILPILQHLEDFGYLIPKETEYSGRGRPRADSWVVNPLLFQGSGSAA